MRHAGRTAFAVLLVVVFALAGWQVLTTADLPAEAAPNATYDVSDDADGELVVRWFGEAGRTNLFETRL